MLPVSVAGVLLLLVSLGLFVTDALVTSHGALTLAGAVTFVIGALMLFDPAGPAYQVSLWTALAIAGTLVLLLGRRALADRPGPAQPGRGQRRHGSSGSRARCGRNGLVAVNGELWRARRADGGMLAARRASVTVESVRDDLVLVVGSGNSSEGI